MADQILVFDARLDSGNFLSSSSPVTVFEARLESGNFLSTSVPVSVFSASLESIVEVIVYPTVQLYAARLESVAVPVYPAMRRWDPVAGVSIPQNLYRWDDEDGYVPIDTL